MAASDARLRLMDVFCQPAKQRRREDELPALVGENAYPPVARVNVGVVWRRHMILTTISHVHREGNERLGFEKLANINDHWEIKFISGASQ